MFKEKMITLKQPTSLQNIFTHLSNGSPKILLWQNIQESNRKICQNARIGQLNLGQEEMTFYPHKGEFNFHHHSYLYFFGLKRTTIFKAPILYHSRLKMVIRLPKLIMMANSRLAPREDCSSVDTLLQYTHHAHSDTGSNHFYHNSKLLDISAHGLSFKSSLHNTLRFRKGDRLWFQSPYLDESFLEGEVRHVSECIDLLTHEKYLRIGVKL